MMKTIKNSIVFKVILGVLILSAIGLLVDLSFWLMNMADTLALIGGAILFTVSVGVPLEILIKRFTKTKK
jgi:ABC-type proline/glycine betaine transport system permease subunit